MRATAGRRRFGIASTERQGTGTHPNGLAADMPAIRRILFPTDFSREAAAALPYATGFAKGTAAEIVLLHVLPSPATYAVPLMSGVVWTRIAGERRKAAGGRLRRLEERVRSAVPRTHGVVAEGAPFRQIVRAAKRLRCDLIVLATHGRTGLAHAFLGSVAERVVRGAPCPVLVVPPPGGAG